MPHGLVTSAIKWNVQMRILMWRYHLVSMAPKWLPFWKIMKIASTLGILLKKIILILVVVIPSFSSWISTAIINLDSWTFFKGAKRSRPKQPSMIVKPFFTTLTPLNARTFHSWRFLFWKILARVSTILSPFSFCSKSINVLHLNRSCGCSKWY